MIEGFEHLDSKQISALIADVQAKKYGESDKDWAELVQQYELRIKPDTLRKATVGLVLADSVAEEKPQAPAVAKIESPQIPEMEDAERTYIEKQKLRDLRTQVNEGLRAMSRSSHLEELIVEAVANLKPIEAKPKPERVYEVRNKKLVVCLGDFHYGAEYEVKGMNNEILREYNPEFFDAYMENLLSQIREVITQWDIEDVEVLFTGDLIDGMLRDSQLMRLRYGIVDSTIKLGEYLAVWLMQIDAMIAGRVSAHCTLGNHSEIRPLGSKAGRFPDENMERILMWYLNARLADTYINVDAYAGEYKMIEICGYNFVLLHGENLGFRDISDIARDTVNLYGKRVDFFVCGHMHREETIRSGMTKDGNSYIIRVPALCGTDPYSASKGAGNTPGALAIVMEEGYGRRCEYPMKLS